MKLHGKSMDTVSDEKIVELYWQRDENAIKETDIKYRRFLISVAYNIVFNKNDCEECLNDTYVGAWNAMPPARPTLLQAFLATIMRRTAIDCYKAKKRQKRVASGLTICLDEVSEFIADGEDVHTALEAKELGRIISDFVRSLSERRMYIFMSRYYFARPVKEISGLLLCSESTVAKEIAFIKKELREKLHKEGYSV